MALKLRNQWLSLSGVVALKFRTSGSERAGIIKVEGLDLMKEPIAVDFYARQQVREDDKVLLHHLVSNIYLNNCYIIRFYRA